LGEEEEEEEEEEKKEEEGEDAKADTGALKEARVWRRSGEEEEGWR